MKLIASISNVCLALALTCVPAIAVSQAKDTQRNVEPTAPSGVSPVGAGKYYALVIGNNDYQFLPKLLTANNDAQAMAKLLTEEYGFGTTLLLNATREQILNAFAVYRQKLSADSHLLIYFAGHGKNDSEADVAYWLPTDAHPVNSANWISAEDITAELRVIKALHVLVVADSCYSGKLSRGIESADVSIDIRPSEMGTYIAKLDRIRSRDLFASGGNEPVADGGPDGHSIFASILLRTLRDVPDKQFTAASIFQRIAAHVGGQALQTPRYSLIPNSSDDGGDFIFVRQRGVAPIPLCCLVNLPDQPASLLVDVKQTLSDALQNYCGAYQSGDVDTLKNLWPTIAPKKVKDLKDFLQGGRTISLDCKLKGEPQVLGETASIDIIQNWKYKAGGKTIQVPTEYARMKLKKAPGATTPDWKIEWIQ